MSIVCIAGQENKDRYYASIAGNGGSEELCKRQIEAYRGGICEAHIVKSKYGYSLRYASGLHNFGLIRKAAEMGGTLEAAIEYAKKWQSEAPQGRFVTISQHYLDEENRLLENMADKRAYMNGLEQ